MEFEGLKVLIQQNFAELAKDATKLFEVNIDKDKIWELYLESFAPETNGIFRERTEHDCSACRSFIRNIGGAVFIKDNKLVSIWDVDAKGSIYEPVVAALSKYVKSKAISDIYVSKFKKIGINKNDELLDNGKVITWEHFYLELPDKFVDKSHKSEGELKGNFHSAKDAFANSLEKITKDSVLTLLELIAQGSLYKGDEYKHMLTAFLKVKEVYDTIPLEEKDNFVWDKTVSTAENVCKIRSSSIGNLLEDISNGVDLESAVKSYENMTAPTNYKRPKSIFTKKMLEDAIAKIEELGYTNSLERRYAILDDIRINNILFSNKDAAKRIIGGESIFDSLAKETSSSPKKYSKVEEISIEDFIKNVLPSTTSVEALFDNKLAANMVSLIAPIDKAAPSMFKWDNAFSWAYTGNITDSDIRERVKSAGGNVDGVLRFSIQWNEINKDLNDYDAHCIEPNGNEIYYGNLGRSGNSIVNRTTGNLDVDIIHPTVGKPAVENITWLDINKMAKGTYKFFVRNFTHNGGRDGFRAEIAFAGQIYSFAYNKELKSKEDILVAEVRFDGTTFTLVEKLPSNVSSREVWGIHTNDFVPVSTIMFSPNYWDEQKGIGHKHYFFMLKDCVNPESPNGFYNEFLKDEIITHKRMFEAIGGKTAVKPMDDQLSGFGFSSTKRAELVVKVIGKTERLLKIKF